MSPRRPPRTTLRVVVESVIAGIIGFAGVALIILFLRPDSEGEQAEIAEDAISVDEVVKLGSTRAEDVVVTGFVFVGDERAVLCSQRDDEDPPFCDGNAITLENLDTSRLDLVIPDDAPAYSRNEVTLAGTYSRAVLTVREILN